MTARCLRRPRRTARRRTTSLRRRHRTRGRRRHPHHPRHPRGPGLQSLALLVRQRGGGRACPRPGPALQVPGDGRRLSGNLARTSSKTPPLRSWRSRGGARRWPWTWAACGPVCAGCARSTTPLRDARTPPRRRRCRRRRRRRPRSGRCSGWVRVPVHRESLTNPPRPSERRVTPSSPFCRGGTRVRAGAGAAAGGGLAAARPRDARAVAGCANAARCGQEQAGTAARGGGGCAADSGRRRGRA